MKQKKMIANENTDINSDNIRLNKFLSDSGVCSRREADKYIESGKVKINGQVALMGQRVGKNDEVTFNNKKISIEKNLILLAFNKPVGIECTSDRKNPDNIIDFIKYPKKIFYIGRLDKNSSGLILMTNDGNLADKISKSVNHHEKEYIVKVNKKINDKFIDKMSSGVDILDTNTRECKVEKIDDYTFNIILTQGLNRQIRRMCEALSYKVVDLKRIRVLNIELGRLKIGDYRNVSNLEIEKLLSLVK